MREEIRSNKYAFIRTNNVNQRKVYVNNKCSQEVNEMERNILLKCVFDGLIQYSLMNIYNKDHSQNDYVVDNIFMFIVL